MNAQTEIETLRHFIGGAWGEASGGETFEVLNPLDDSPYATAARGTGEDMARAIAAAKAAFAEYRETTPTERERWLLRVAEIMERRQKDLIDCLIDEIGSPVQKAMFEFSKGLTMVRAAAGLCRQVRGETIPSDAPGKFSMSIREPLGVVAVITPFNVPLIKTTRLVANALALGNTVVHLPSEMAPHLTVLFAEIVAEAGVPAGAYNVVTGFGYEIGDALTGSKDIDFLTFTGSTAIGQHINEICAKNKTPATLELGGKSPTLVMADADLDKVMPLAARSIFMFAGQACIGSSRFYVERPVYDEFVTRFAMIAGKIGMGDLREPEHGDRADHLGPAAPAGQGPYRRRRRQGRDRGRGRRMGGQPLPAHPSDRHHRGDDRMPDRDLRPRYLDLSDRQLRGGLGEGERYGIRALLGDLHQGHRPGFSLRQEHQRGHVPHQRPDHP